MLILTATLITSCVDRLEATKYTIDTLQMKSGKKLRGTILGEDRLYFTLRDDQHSELKVLLKDDVTSFGKADRIMTKDGGLFLCSVEKMEMSLENEGGEPVDFNISDVRELIYNEEGKSYMVLTKSGDRLSGQITSDGVGVVTVHGEKQIRPNLISRIMFMGTPKEEDQSISELWNDLAENMGVQNVVPKSDTGRKDNGWLFTLIGILVVFIALAFMVLVFSLMKNLSKEKKKDGRKKGKSKSDSAENKEVGLKEGELSPDIVSAIAITLALTEGEEKPKFTFKRDKVSNGSWAYSGRFDSTRKDDFRRG